MFTSLLYSKRGVLYCLRDFYIAREVFCIVYVTFIQEERCFVIVCVTFTKKATCFEILLKRHFYIAREVFCIVYVTFIQQERCFVLFTSLLYSSRGVLNCLAALSVIPLKRADLSHSFTSLLDSKRGVLYCLPSLLLQQETHVLYCVLQLLYSKRGVLYCLPTSLLYSTRASVIFPSFIDGFLGLQLLKQSKRGLLYC